VSEIDFSLYAILDTEIERRFTVEEFTGQVIDGGATCLQIRCKHDSTRSIMEFARRVMAAAAGTAVPVIVNDRVDVAVALGARGVHVGEEDMPVADAKRICGSTMTVGATVRDVAAARRAVADGADYLGVGPIFETPVKPGLIPIAPGTLRAIRREISLPIVAIGGINEANAAVPLEEGADGIAVISALRRSHSPKEAASRLRRAIDETKKR
jgi:thiamine-phosphate pyrophosphorylase